MNLLIYIKLLIIFNIILLSKRSQTSLLSKRKKKMMKKKNTTWFHRKWKLVHSDRKQRTGCLGTRGRQEGEIIKSFRKCLWWWICLLSWLWWWWLHRFIRMSKLTNLYTFKYVQFMVCQLYFNKAEKRE